MVFIIVTTVFMYTLYTHTYLVVQKSTGIAVNSVLPPKCIHRPRWEGHLNVPWFIYWRTSSSRADLHYSICNHTCSLCRSEGFSSYCMLHVRTYVYILEDICARTYVIQSNLLRKYLEGHTKSLFLLIRDAFYQYWLA